MLASLFGLHFWMHDINEEESSRNGELQHRTRQELCGSLGNKET